jgi:hypothetical protein
MSFRRIRRPLGDDKGNIIGPFPEPNPPDFDIADNQGPFASTLKRERADLNEKCLQDLKGHKVTRELSEQVFRRWKTDSSITDNFDINNIPSHPDLAESVSSCSETSVYGLHSRDNSAEFSEMKTDLCENGISAPLPSSPDKPKTLIIFYFLANASKKKEEKL